MTNFNFIVTYLQQSSLEICGTITGLFCIYYEVNERHLTWPSGIISSAIYGFLLYQDQLYGQMLFQLITIPISLWGWYMWLKGDFFTEQSKVKIQNLSRRGWLYGCAIILISTLIAYSLEKQFTQRNFVFADAFSAILGVIALLMLGKKIIEQWLLWIIADGVPGLIMLKEGHYLSALLFGCYTVLAIIGYYNWYRLHRTNA